MFYYVPTAFEVCCWPLPSGSPPGPSSVISTVEQIVLHGRRPAQTAGPHPHLPSQRGPLDLTRRPADTPRTRSWATWFLSTTTPPTGWSCSRSDHLPRGDHKFLGPIRSVAPITRDEPLLPGIAIRCDVPRRGPSAFHSSIRHPHPSGCTSEDESSQPSCAEDIPNFLRISGFRWVGKREIPKKHPSHAPR